MLKKYCYHLSLFCCFFLCHAAYAVLDLSLTRGLSAATPVVLQDFALTDVKLKPIADQLHKIMQTDLYTSGQFRFVSSGTDADGLADWRRLGANNAILGKLSRDATGRYHAECRLLGLFNAASSEPNELLTVSFSSDRSGLRQLAHHLADLVYEKVTGIKGYFTSRLAYIRVKRVAGKSQQYQLIVSDQDGANDQVIFRSSEPIMSLSWAPDNRSLLYVSFEHKRSAIIRQWLASGKREILSSAAGINAAPALSPDGRKLAMVLTTTGNPKIYLMDVQTRHLRQVTQGWSIDTEPTWSPDGKRLLFTSNRDGSPQVYSLDVASKRVTRMTFEGHFNAQPKWLPTGDEFVFMHGEDGSFSIARQSLRSGEWVAITPVGRNEAPSVSPNGQMVVYATQKGAFSTLARASIDGRIQLQVRPQDTDIRAPAWSR